jgi:hypothetical protein
MSGMARPLPLRAHHRDTIGNGNWEHGGVEMKGTVAGVLLCALALMGCSRDVERPVPAAERRAVIETPRGKVLVLNPVQDTANRSATAEVVRGDAHYILRFASSGGDGSGVAGGVAELLDESGRLLFAIETLVDRLSGELVFTQRTTEDYLVLRMQDDEERIREQYDANGDVAAFEYPALPEEVRRHAANHYRHGLSTGNLPAPVAEFIGELGAFDAYYEPHSKSTLHDNPSGELLVQILASPDLKHLAGPGAERAQWIQNLCAAARACQSLVCYTRPDSLVCFVCTAVNVACSIVDVICNWIGC